MNLHQLKLDESFLLFQNWWKSTELTNYEKCILNNEIITFNQQLLRLKEKIIRIGVYGKTGVGKSSISNKILQEKFFQTGILNGSTESAYSKEFDLKNNFINSVELFEIINSEISSRVSQPLMLGAETLGIMRSLAFRSLS